MIVYTKSGCGYCKRAKDLIEHNSISYQELEIGRDITREEIISKFPHRKELPIITEDDGRLIGGYADLIDYLNPPLS